MVFDLIYNREKATVRKKAEEQGAKILNGYNMLERQAELSWQIWNQ